MYEAACLPVSFTHFKGAQIGQEDKRQSLSIELKFGNGKLMASFVSTRGCSTVYLSYH